MALSLKRAFVKADLDKENALSASSTAIRSANSSSSSSSLKVKRPCLMPSTANNLLYIRSQGCQNSSSEDDSSDDEQISRRNNRLRNQRRNYRNVKKCLSSLPLDTKLSKAVALYSDDEEVESEAVKSTDSEHTSTLNSSRHHNRSHSFRRYSISSNVASPSIALSPSFDSKCRHYVPTSDFTARSRCFDYLVGAIDEAWARYCDATSYDEDEVYGYDSGSGAPHTPASVLSSDDDEGYKSETSVVTSITDYDSDFQVDTSRKAACAATRRVSEVPANVRLQQLKDRLIKAKYYLQDYVDSGDSDECLLFWKKWDLIKYATIELVEDDDDDQTVENQIEELERGRFSLSMSV